MNKEQKILISIAAVLLIGAILYDIVHGRTISGPFDAMLKIAMLLTSFILGWELRKAFTHKD
ncbi:MAG: hypothetical protein HDQ88_11095 [Clostridia bacterium]|nr:hypothetical protein [Clostridia bacterium]